MGDHVEPQASGTNYAVVYSEPPSLKTEVVELAIPPPGPGELLVRMLFSGVCHTDYGFCTNGFVGAAPTPPRQVGGHEGLGQVIRHGPGVTTPPIGSHVGIKYSVDACLACANCLQGGETSCLSSAHARVSGYTHPGTFQQYCVTPAAYATPIPASLDLAAAAPLMCGGVSVYAALKRAAPRLDDWVVVSGAGGGLGHLAVQYARVMGARVLGVDAAAKEPLVRALGAHAFLDFAAGGGHHDDDDDDDAALAARVREITGGGGARVVLVCVSSARAYAQAMQWLGFRGKLCCLGIPEQEPGLVASVLGMVMQELTVMANKSGNRLEAIEAVEIAARHGIKTQYQLRKMKSLTKIFEEMEAGSISGRTVLDLR